MHQCGVPGRVRLVDVDQLALFIPLFENPGKGFVVPMLCSFLKREVAFRIHSFKDLMDEACFLCLMEDFIQLLSVATFIASC